MPPPRVSLADVALDGEGVLTAEGEDGGGALGAGEGALGVALGDGTENEVGDAVGHLVLGSSALSLHLVLSEDNICVEIPISGCQLGIGD